MKKKEYWVYVPKANGGYKSTRFATKRAAERYKSKFKEAYIKKYEYLE